MLSRCQPHAFGLPSLQSQEPNKILVFANYHSQVFCYSSRKQTKTGHETEISIIWVSFASHDRVDTEESESRYDF